MRVKEDEDECDCDFDGELQTLTVNELHRSNRGLALSSNCCSMLSVGGDLNDGLGLKSEYTVHIWAALAWGTHSPCP